MASVHIHLPSALSERASGTATLAVEAASVSEALAALATRHPEAGRLLFGETGELRPHVSVFVADRRADPAEGRPLAEGDEIRIVPSIAGG